MNNILLIIAALFYMACAAWANLALARRQNGASAILPALLAPGFAAHSAALILGWTAQGQFPVSGAGQVCSFIAWALAAWALWLNFRYAIRAPALSAFLTPLALLFSLASLVLPGPRQATTAWLSGAIDASAITPFIFPVHVSLVLLAYAAFIVTFICSVMYLALEHELRNKHFGGAFQRLPSLGTCDELSHRALTIGFAMLTLGMLTGMIWNQQRVGHWWQNDPKEVFALATWLVYFAVIHYRLAAGWRGRRVALLGIAGFIITLLTWIGARFMGGYHVFG
ncbi:MAG: inner membrane protein YpjD [Blastocatellia bacterium]